MPSGDVIKPQTVPTSGLNDPISYCQIKCIYMGQHYFAVQQNKTCQCIDQVPLGGKYCCDVVVNVILYVDVDLMFM